MPRKPKYINPDQTIEDFYASVSDAYNSPGEGEQGRDGKKKQELLAEEFGISRIKVRKILITTGDLTYPETREIQAALDAGKTIKEISVEMGISPSTVNSLLPYSKGVYGLDVSAAADRTQIYRARKQIIIELKNAIQTGDWSQELWKAICLFQNYPFFTAGRKRKNGGEAESRRGSLPGKKYKYSVSKEGAAGGRRYAGESVEGYGKEMCITTAEGEKKKSISRSTVELANKNALAAGGVVKGPKALNVPGAHSYLYPILVWFGVISSPSTVD